MKQKIVIKLRVECDKCRSKAMEVATRVSGVTSVGIEGPDRDQLVVTGNEVDAACLACSLRKKIGYASLVSVEEVKPPKGKGDGKDGKDGKDDKKKDDGKKKPEEKKKCECVAVYNTPYPCAPPCYEPQVVVCESQQGCSIM